MIKLYASVESGSVDAIDGNSYRICNGVVMVPECCAADLMARGFVPAEKPAPAEVATIEPVEVAPARKRKAK